MKQLGRYVKKDKQIVDTHTGELVDVNEIKRTLEEDLIDIKNKNTRIMAELGIPIEIKLVRDKTGEPYETLIVKENHEFNKIFRGDVNDMFEHSDLSIEAAGFLGRFSSKLHFPSNSILLDGKHPNQEEMCEYLRIGRTKLNSILKELEFYDVIKRVKMNGKTYIYVNPFLYSTGRLSIDTYRLFAKSAYNPNKNVSNIV